MGSKKKPRVGKHVPNAHLNKELEVWRRRTLLGALLLDLSTALGSSSLGHLD